MLRFMELWQQFQKKHLGWDGRDTRSSEAWVTYFRASENYPNKLFREICTVQHQMCIVQVPYQCADSAIKGIITLILEENHAHVRFAQNIPIRLRVVWSMYTSQLHTSLALVAKCGNTIMIYTGKYVDLICHKFVWKLLWCSLLCLERFYAICNCYSVLELWMVSTICSCLLDKVNRSQLHDILVHWYSMSRVLLLI